MDSIVVALIALAFPLWWCFVVSILAWSSGWRALSKKYRAETAPSGKRFPFQSIRMGTVNYSGGLTIVVSPLGLYLKIFPFFRLGHPPLLIPWSDIHNLKEKRILLWRMVQMEIGAPAITTLMLPLYIIEELPIEQ